MKAAAVVASLAVAAWLAIGFRHDAYNPRHWPDWIKLALVALAFCLFLGVVSVMAVRERAQQPTLLVEGAMARGVT